MGVLGLWLYSPPFLGFLGHVVFPSSFGVGATFWVSVLGCVHFRFLDRPHFLGRNVFTSIFWIFESACVRLRFFGRDHFWIEFAFASTFLVGATFWVFGSRCVHLHFLGFWVGCVQLHLLVPDVFVSIFWSGCVHVYFFGF